MTSISPYMAAAGLRDFRLWVAEVYRTTNDPDSARKLREFMDLIDSKIGVLGGFVRN